MKQHNNTIVSRALLALVALVSVSIPASASIIFDGSGAASNTFQQKFDSPCVIADDSCKEPAGFTDTINTGPGDYDLFSPVYDVPAIFTTYSGNLIELSFRIGIDSNIATGHGLQTLEFFKTYACDSNGLNCVLDAGNSYLTPTLIPDNHNGNGFSDATLGVFTLVAGTKYKFEADVSNQSDGMEQFFILPLNAQAVPEPMTMGAAATGLVALFFLKRRKRGS
jgi:hypothetical protein